MKEKDMAVSLQWRNQRISAQARKILNGWAIIPALNDHGKPSPRRGFWVIHIGAELFLSGDPCRLAEAHRLIHAMPPTTATHPSLPEVKVLMVAFSNWKESERARGK